MQYAAAAVTALARPFDEGRGPGPACLHRRNLRTARGDARRVRDRRSCSSARASARGPARTRSSISGTQGLLDCRHRPPRSGSATPHFSQWKEQRPLRRPAPRRRPRSSSASSTTSPSGSSYRSRDRASCIRYVMVTHHDDGVARARTRSCSSRRPRGSAILRSGPRPEIPQAACAGLPTTTFFQALVDMKNSANVVAGVFAATGHDYRGDLLPFFRGCSGSTRPTSRSLTIPGKATPADRCTRSRSSRERWR